MSGAGISISVGTDYASFHQVGTRYMPQRRILPDGALPAEWQAAIKVAIENAFGQVVR
jgi:hypothetical protein